MNRSNKSDPLLVFFACVVILLSVFENLVVFPGIPLGKTPPAMAAAFLLLLFVAKALPRYKLQSGLEKWVVAFVATSGISFFMSMSDKSYIAGLAGVLSWIQPMILFFMWTFIASQSEKASKYMLFSFVGSGLLLILLGAIGADTSQFEESQGRAGYDGVNLNRQAYVYSCTALAMCWIFLEAKAVTGLKLLLVVGLFAVLTVGLVMSGSRTGVGAFGVSFISLILLSGRNRFSGRLVVGSAIAVAIASGVLVYRGDVILNRISRTMEGQDYGYRDILILASWELSKNSPLFGYGPYAYGILGEAVGKERIDAHNAHFQVVLQVGYPVYVIWIGFMLSTMFFVWKYRMYPIARLCVVTMVFLFCFSLGSSLASDLGYWITMSLIIGGMQATVLKQVRIAQQHRLANHYRYA